MRVIKRFSYVFLCLFGLGLASSVSAQTVTCDTANGTRFNLEPRVNSVIQNSESVDFMLNRVSPGVDLLVGAAHDQRGDFRLFPGFSPDLRDGVYYVHRAGSNCAADFEGTLATLNGTVFTLGTPTVVADRARDAFFLSDDALGGAVVVGRTNAPTLLSTTKCPNGTHDFAHELTCWPVVNFVTFGNGEILDPHMAVDERTSGTGAGDVYVATQVENTANFPATSSVQIAACTNATLVCSTTPVVASGADTFGTHPYVQVRRDGIITLSYWTYTLPFNSTPPIPIEIKFVTCKPQGAPLPPVCSTPAVVASSKTGGGFAPAAEGFEDFLFPQHTNRLEADGKTVTTFLIYDRCRALIGQAFLVPACSKVDVVLTTSVNNGATWTAPTVVSTAVGHHYMGAIRTDPSTNVVNIAYYSTEKDPFEQRSQIFLKQIEPGSTAVGAANILTSASNDPNSGIGDLTRNLSFGDINFGDRIGLAVAGNGTKGESRAYVHYTWNNVRGLSNGISQPDPNNTLVPFSY